MQTHAQFGRRKEMPEADRDITPNSEHEIVGSRFLRTGLKKALPVELFSWLSLPLFDPVIHSFIH
jgi:hypothetical protein